MRFLSIYKTVECNTPPAPEEMAAMGKLIQEGMQAGWLVSTEGCLPTALGARVRRSEGKVMVTDGPFTESKELIGGFWIIQVKSREEAIEWAKRAPCPHGEGNDAEIEIRQFYELEDFTPVEAIDRARELRNDQSYEAPAGERAQGARS